jgi:small-conductance mechanosensitive channel
MEQTMSSFMIYAIGFVILLAGLIYGASLFGVPTPWIVAGGLVVLGLGIAMGVGKTRQKDIPER